MNPTSAIPDSNSLREHFHLKAYDAADLEKRFIAAVHHLKPHPLSKLWIVLPHFCHHAHWKEVLIEHQIPALNIHFLTPSQLRQKLPPILDLEFPLPLNRESMRLILEKTCEPLQEKYPLFRPLSRDARPLLRTLDEMENSGLQIQDLDEVPELDPWLKNWASIQLGPWGRANQDHQILEAAKNLPQPLPDACLWLGLDRQSLAFAPLLQATTFLFKKLAALYLTPEVDEESVQQIWLQRIEEWLPQAAEKIPSESMDPHSLESTLQSSFYCAPSLRHEAELIISLIQHARATTPEPQKIGVVIPSSSPLGLWIGMELENQKIPFYSTWGEPPPPEPGEISLLALLKLQIDEIDSPDFLDFLEVHRHQESFWKTLEATPDQISEIRDHLYRSFQKTLSTRISDALPHPIITRFENLFKNNLQYPEELTLKEGVSLTAAQIQKIFGLEASEPLKEYLDDALLDLDHIWKRPLQKKDYLRLLQRLLQSPESKPIGDPWASLWILKPEEATTLSWHTLIFTQLNEAFWPSLRDSGVSLLNDETRTRLNQRLTHHHPFQPLTTLSSLYQMERARFNSLLSSVQSQCYFTASASNELEAGDELYPSEFYRQAWNQFNPSHPWKESYWNALLHQAPEMKIPSPHRSDSALQKAFSSRLNPHIPLDDFLFCDPSSDKTPRPLSVTQAEKILQDPATAWFETYLGVRSFPESWKSRDLLGLIQGNRLHEWIADSFRALTAQNEFNPLPSLKAWQESLQKTLKRAHQKHLQNLNAPLWWKNHFSALEWKAEKLLENLHQTLSQMPDSHIACEYRLKRPMIHPLPEFPIEQEWLGRIDWIALNHTQWDQAKKIWIIDLKTGSGSNPFNQTSLLQKADYFQLLAYAGLVRAQHPGHPEISVGVILPKWTPPVEMTPLDAFDPKFLPLWKVLSAAWNKGLFGQAHEIHQRFSQSSDLPLATTPIPQEILDSKWNLTPELSAWPRN